MPQDKPCMTPAKWVITRWERPRWPVTDWFYFRKKEDQDEVRVSWAEQVPSAETNGCFTGSNTTYSQSKDKWHLWKGIVFLGGEESRWPVILPQRALVQARSHTAGCGMTRRSHTVVRQWAERQKQACRVIGFHKESGLKTERKSRD